MQKLAETSGKRPREVGKFAPVSCPGDRAAVAHAKALLGLDFDDDDGDARHGGAGGAGERFKLALPACVRRAYAKVIHDKRFVLHRVCLEACRALGDERGANAVQRRMDAEGLVAIAAEAHVDVRAADGRRVRQSYVDGPNIKTPPTLGDLVDTLLRSRVPGGRYEPQLRALPYNVQHALVDRGEAEMHRSLALHAEKKALAVLLLEHLDRPGSVDLNVDVNFKMCVDCHAFFKAASVHFNLRLTATERGRPSHDFSRGSCSCNDRWRWDGMVNEDDVPVKPRPEARDCPAPRADDDSERAPRRG